MPDAYDYVPNALHAQPYFILMPVLKAIIILFMKMRKLGLGEAKEIALGFTNRKLGWKVQEFLTKVIF